MKRSEMVKNIDTLIKLKYKIKGVPLTAEEILFEVEKSGMLPPPVMKGSFFEGCQSGAIFKGNYWEPEDE